MRRAVTLVTAAVAAALPPHVNAQEWSVLVGGAARAEYRDNYFFEVTNEQSAYVLSVTPFVTAARKTETSEVTALLAVGGNLVSGSVPTSDYLSGRFELNGSQRDARSTWSGQVSLIRAPSLQSEITPAGVVYGLAHSENATVNGAYRYKLSDAWSLGATALAYANRYDAVQANDGFQSNHGYAVGGTADYIYSDRTRITFATVFSYFSSDLDRGDSATATVGIAHEFSPQLTVTASAGGFWLNPEASAISTGQRDVGALLGASIAYDLGERTRLFARLSETLSPSGAGVLTKDDSVSASLSHAFSDRLTGLIGAGYRRENFLSAPGGSFDNDYYAVEVGASYKFSERWTLDAGYRYARAKYAQSADEPKSNVAFLNISYNWPGASTTDWIGSRQDAQGLPGVGPISPSGTSAQPGPTPTARSPFDQYWIPW